MSNVNEKPKPDRITDAEGAVKNQIVDGPEGMRRFEDLMRRLLKVTKPDSVKPSP